jgi:hypothetical protein
VDNARLEFTIRTELAVIEVERKDHKRSMECKRQDFAEGGDAYEKSLSSYTILTSTGKPLIYL